jgi:hypothetical protein
MVISQIVPFTLGMLLTREFSRLIVSRPLASLALRCRAFTTGTAEHCEQYPKMTVREPMDEAREGTIFYCSQEGRAYAGSDWEIPIWFTDTVITYLRLVFPGHNTAFVM